MLFIYISFFLYLIVKLTHFDQSYQFLKIVIRFFPAKITEKISSCDLKRHRKESTKKYFHFIYFVIKRASNVEEKLLACLTNSFKIGLQYFMT